jgi:hypothetical protein
MIDYLIVSSLGLSYFIYYVEFSPSLGNIWYRPDETGKKVIQLEGLLSLMYEPFKKREFWYFKNWDLNWITTVFSIVFSYYIVKNMIYNEGC